MTQTILLYAGVILYILLALTMVGLFLTKQIKPKPFLFLTTTLITGFFWGLYYAGVLK